jgi:fatty acid desaturase
MQHDYRIRRNPNYFNSVKLVFTKVIWEAPVTFLMNVGVAFAELFTAMLLAVMTMVSWVVVIVVCIVAGLFGFLHENETPVSQPAGKP